MMRVHHLKNSTMIFFKKAFLVFLAAVSLWMAAGCGVGPYRAAPDSINDPFRPPTLVPTPLPPTQTPPSLSPPGTVTAEVSCRDNLTYLSDISIPDGTVVAPGSTIDKRWEVENSGSCNWEEGYQIRLISDQALGSPKELTLVPARSGSRVEIRIVFTAPEQEGKYRSAWQAFNPQNVAFGDPIYIEISVKKKN
jgi:hypothetical protein